jgi:hypothetical protein
VDGAGPQAVNAPRTFAARRPRGSAAWRVAGGPTRARSGTSGRSQREARSAANPAEGTCPRARPRSRSPGTNASASTSGRPTTPATTAARAGARSRRPRSFHAETSVRARASYTSAPRARTNASLRPAHSTQRRTGHVPGHPQRSQTGGPILIRRSSQRAQSEGPGAAHTAQREGSTSPSTPIPATVRLRPRRVGAGFVPTSSRAVAQSSTELASSSRRPSRERTRSSGSLIGKNRPRGPERGTSRNVVASAHETW